MFTFNPALTDPLDRLRLAVGDTDADDPLMENATYDALLVAHDGDEGAAAATIARALIARYSRMPDRVTRPDGSTVSWKDRLAAWQALLPAPAPRASGGGFRIVQPSRGEARAEYFAGRRCLDREL